jgi:hypothetical protein
MLLLLLLQTAAAQAPDIQLNANIRARSVTIEKQGNARLTVTTSPNGGNLVDLRAPRGNGQKSLRNVEVNLRAEARIGDPAAAPANNPPQAETPPPQ